MRPTEEEGKSVGFTRRFKHLFWDGKRPNFGEFQGVSRILFWGREITSQSPHGFNRKDLIDVRSFLETGERGTGVV